MAWRLAKDRSLTEPIMTPFADVSGPNDLNDRQQTDESAKKYTKYFYKQNDTSGKIWRKLSKIWMLILHVNRIKLYSTWVTTCLLLKDNNNNKKKQNK